LPKHNLQTDAHQASPSQRANPADRDRPEINNEAKFRRFLSLQFFQRGDYRHNLLRAGRGVRPIGKKTIAEILVNYSVLILDDLLARENPGSEQNIQVLALHLATEWRKTANIRKQTAGWNSLEFPQRTSQHVAC